MYTIGTVPTIEAIHSRELKNANQMKREIALSAMGSIKKKKRTNQKFRDPKSLADWKRDIRRIVNPSHDERLLMYHTAGNQDRYTELFFLNVKDYQSVYNFMKDYSLNAFYLEMPLSDIPSGRWFDGFPNIKQITDNRFVLRYQWLLDC